MSYPAPAVTLRSMADFLQERDPRVPLAAERTLLAWVRTGLAMMGFGFVVARFGLFLREMAAVETRSAPAHAHLSLWGGTLLVALGVVVNVLAGIDHARFIARFNRGETARPRILSIGVVLSFVLAILGVALCVYLVTTR